jgi:hypothetical protein
MALFAHTGERTMNSPRHDHWTQRIFITCGVKWMATHGSAWWLIDLVASYTEDPRLQGEEFQHWRLVVDTEARTGTVTVDDGNDDEPIIKLSIEYCDYPEAECELYLVGPAPFTLMLPCEY